MYEAGPPCVSRAVDGFVRIGMVTSSLLFSLFISLSAAPAPLFFYFLIFFSLVRFACFREYTPFTTTSALRFREVDEIMFGIWIRFEV
jgi:hypothetical protein